MRVQAKLVSDIKRPFRLEGMERIDDTSVHKAIREALTNLVIHADYMVTGVLKVEKHDDCFVFSNPGTLKIPVMDIYAGGNSKARNPNMQSMFANDWFRRQYRFRIPYNPERMEKGKLA